MRYTHSILHTDRQTEGHRQLEGHRVNTNCLRFNVFYGCFVFVSACIFVPTSICMFVRMRTYTVWFHNWIFWPHDPSGNRKIYEMARMSGHKNNEIGVFSGRKKSFDLSLGFLWSFLCFLPLIFHWFRLILSMDIFNLSVGSLSSLPSFLLNFA